MGGSYGTLDRINRMKPDDEPHWWVVGPTKYQQYRKSGGRTLGEVWPGTVSIWRIRVPGWNQADTMEFASEAEAKNFVEVTINLSEEN